jgi:ribonuclease-3
MTTNYLIDGFKVINNGEEEIVQIPYNLNNILIEEIDIIKMLERFNVKIDKVNNLEAFREAFTHKSYCKKSIFPDDILDASKKEMGNPPELLELRNKSFERMEYLGDRVLKVIVSNYLFHRYPNENEGFMTRLQTKLEDKKDLPILSKEMGLGKYFIISKHIESMNGRNLDKIHEDVFEAFIAALYLSNGFEPCLLLITNLLETLVDYSEKLYCDNNYKDILLRHHHTNSWTHPEYKIIYNEGPPHKRKYIVGVFKHDIEQNDLLRNKFIGYGIGNSHKEGEQNAAKMALIIYGVLNNDQYVQSDIYYPSWDRIEKGDNTILSINKIEQVESDNESVLSEKSI